MCPSAGGTKGPPETPEGLPVTKPAPGMDQPREARDDEKNDCHLQGHITPSPQTHWELAQAIPILAPSHSHLHSASEVSPHPRPLPSIPMDSFQRLLPDL